MNDGERIAKIEVIVERMEPHLEKIATLLLGGDENPGIIRRLDRVEQSRKTQCKHLWTLYAGVVLGAIKWLFDHFGK